MSSDLQAAINNVKGQIIVFNGMYRMLPRLPPKIFRSPEHMKEVAAAIMAYNERLESELESLEEQLLNQMNEQHPKAA